jgi:hypothetical protein
MRVDFLTAQNRNVHTNFAMIKNHGYLLLTKPGLKVIMTFVRCGWVSERFMVAVLKTAEARASVGSNPTPSAIFLEAQFEAGL